MFDTWPRPLAAWGGRQEAAAHAAGEARPAPKSLHAVHRLDRLTSGLLLLCRTPEAARTLSAEMQQQARRTLSPPAFLSINRLAQERSHSEGFLSLACFFFF